MVQLRWSGLTHVGKVRAHNEDMLALLPRRGVFAVMDGMGGASSGEVAAQVAVESLGLYLQGGGPEQYGGAGGLLKRLSDAVLDQAERERRLKGMGATAALVWLRADGVIEVGHVGDCRVYRWRAGELDLLTEDQTLLNDMASAQHMPPEMAASFQYRNVVTQALGLKREVSPQVRRERWCVGDVYVLCSDGVHEQVEGLLARVLWRRGADVERVCAEVMAGVLAGPASDNATVVAVAVEEERGAV